MTGCVESSDLLFHPLSSPPSPHPASPIIEADTPVHAEVGSTAHLYCSVNTTATLWWTFPDGTAIPYGEKYTTVMGTRSITLVIAMVTSQDDGEYVCNAGNTLGVQLASVFLRGE